MRMFLIVPLVVALFPFTVFAQTPAYTDVVQTFNERQSVIATATGQYSLIVGNNALDSRGTGGMRVWSAFGNALSVTGSATNNAPTLIIAKGTGQIDSDAQIQVTSGSTTVFRVFGSATIAVGAAEWSVRTTAPSGACAPGSIHSDTGAGLGQPTLYACDASGAWGALN